MKIVISGPQGCGKSTISTSIVRALNRQGKSVKVITEYGEIIYKTPRKHKFDVTIIEKQCNV